MFRQNNKLHVLLIIDLSCSYTRNLLKGVSQYAQNNEHWDIEATFSFLGKDYHKGVGLEKATIDGIICFDVGSNILRKVLESNIPAIVRGPDKPIHGYINFSTDNLMLCKMAYDYFRHLGFQHFAYCGVPQASWSTERADMMRHILSVHGHPLMVYPPRAKISRKWAAEKPVLMKWLLELPKPIAMLAANDFRGKEVLEACRECGIQVPEQIAVMGIDDDECVSPFTRPTLSSIRRSYLKAGYEAAETLNSLMTGQVPEQHVIIVEPQEVVVRQSTNIFAVADERIAKALLFIHSNATRPISIDDVARDVAVHKRVLYNLFKEHTGQTVHEAIRMVRSDHIAKLLLETDLTVSQIASQVGFDDVGHCARFFKKAKGMSPTDYRNYYIPL